MNQPARFVLVLCLFLALAACTSSTATPTPSATPLPPAASPLPTAAETPTAAAPPSPEPTITAENTPIPATLTETRLQPTNTATIPALPASAAEIIPCTQKLAPGNYLLTFTYNPASNTTVHFAISETGEQIELGKCALYVSPDGRFALEPHYTGTKETGFEWDKFFVVDLVRGEIIATIENNYPELSLSLNALWVARPKAVGDRAMHFGVAAFAPNDPTSYFLFAPPNEDTSFRDLTWSPDGQWLAYQSFPFTDDYSVYVVDVTCLSKPTTCANQQAKQISHQVKLLYGLEWSPSGRYLLEWDVDDELTVYDVRNGGHFRLATEYLPTGITGIGWMPNSDLVAVSVITGFADISTVSADIYIFDLEGSVPVLFKEHTGDLLRNLTILPPFAPGLELSVSLAGHDLNLRAEPSLGGAVLRKLAPGTRLTILEGPAEADGYTWWKMRTADGSEGWAVEVGVWYQPVGGE